MSSASPPAAPEAVPLLPGEETLRGVLERIVFSNDENFYTVGEFRTDDRHGKVTIAGSLPGVQCGETLALHGHWARHAKYGDQFVFTRFDAILPATVLGIRRYLGSGLVRGIGKVYADKIVDVFGADTFKVIGEDSGRLREVPGIGPARAKAIKQAWDEQQGLREVMVFLQAYGVTTGQALRLVKQYGSSARDILKTEPYRVARDVDGIGFATADKLALNLGFANDSPPRVDAGILFALDTLADEGHTAFPLEELRAKAAEMLQCDAGVVAVRVAALLASGELRQPAAGVVQLPAYAIPEERIAQRLRVLAEHRSVLPAIKVEAAVAWAQEKAGFAFAPAQAEAVRNALAHRVSLLTGGPGTGKTTILRALVDILRAKKARVVLASPTGRAAQRMAEATGGFAQTLHRLLRFDPAVGHFTADEDHPLQGELFVVDEASMLDTRLASAFLRAVPPGSHLVLVGDADQLPSVGAGSVLADLIAAGVVPVTRLEHIFRQRGGSVILHAAQGVLQGIPGVPNLVNDLAQVDRSHDFWMLRSRSPEHCLELVIALLRRRIPEQWGFDPLRDVQVLAPLHKGVGGIGNLNRELQQQLNPEPVLLTWGGTSFRKGDKVIQTRNNYDHGIFNGDLGVVTGGDASAGCLVVDFDGDVVELERADLSDLSLAYAVSVHKSQGSEYPAVILPLLSQHYVMLRRNLLYTAITRGKRLVVLVGDPRAYALAAQTEDARVRHTDLRRKLMVAFGRSPR